MKRVIWILGIVMLFASEMPASASKNIFLNFRPLFLECKDNKVHVRIPGGTLSYPEDWRVERLDRGVYKIRYKWWKHSYWKVDLSSRSFYLVRQGKEMWSKAVKVIVVSEETFTLAFPGGTMVLDPEHLSVQLSTEGVVFSYTQGWRVEKVSDTVFTIKHKRWNDFYWRVDTKKKQVMVVTDAGSMIIGASVTIGSPHPSTPKGVTLAKRPQKSEEEVPPSKWQDDRKGLYRQVLSGRTYEVLVVPFQVEGYAIDWTGRSLMTRYLCRWLEETGASVADPTLVMRSLGERQRTYKDEEVFELANALKIKTLIKTYVGYQEGMKFHVVFEIYQRQQNDQLSSNSPVIKIEWRNLKFSHKQPPSEVFLTLKSSILNRLLERKISVEKPEEYSTVPSSIPASFESILKRSKNSPLLSAYYLQFLGLLFPNDGDKIREFEPYEREEFFERSLVALTEVSPESRGYRLLKARALFYLHRRPAAVFALRSPASAEEHAFMAFLNGNLLEMRRWIEEIESPLRRLMAEIEYLDLKAEYGYDIDEEIKTIEAETVDLGQIGFLIKRRARGRDIWFRQSNLIVKRELDRAFPIAEYSAESLLKEAVTLGDLFEEIENFELSPYKHYERYIKENREKIAITKSWYPRPLDLLDILYGIAEANITKRINALLYNQGLPKEADSVLRKYEFYLMGNLRFTYARLSTLQALASKEKDPRVKENMKAEIKRLRRRVCVWSQGQSIYSNSTCGYENKYNNDFPRRWYWVYKGKSPFISKELFPEELTKALQDQGRIIDRLASIQYTLLYSNTDFSALEALHLELKRAGLHDIAERLLELYNNRFIDSPARTKFYAEAFERRGEFEEAIKIYKKYLKFFPTEWWPYEDMGDIYLKTGQLQRAYETYMSYPPFKSIRSSNRVALSNHAFQTGFKFMYLGEIDKAKGFFSISSTLNTGAASEMYSKAFMALFDREFHEAAFHFSALANRYDDIGSEVVYAVLLRLTGYEEVAEQVFKKTARENLNHPRFWKIAYLWHRVAGSSSEDILQWLNNLKGKNVLTEEVMRFLIKIHLIDRRPTQALSALLEEVYTRLTGLDIGTSAHYVSFLSVFAESYYYMKKGEFLKGYNLLKPYIKIFGADNYLLYRFSFPYIAYMAVKSQNEKEFSSILEGYRNVFGEDFVYHLSMAFIEEEKEHHQKAHSHLIGAFYNLPFARDYYDPLSPWFQLVDSCEILYKMHGFEQFRDTLLDLVKRYQKAFVLYGWAYAYEAKYTDSPTNRIKAIAFTLLLDKNSFILSTIPDEEKSKAKEWLKQNIPFSPKEYVESVTSKVSNST